ncbi:hypothetical protein FRC04_003866 [Tulasnella sp. 424]|nr:hypothetical protein FRC04_003866 [Tulasnella sp. 424]KAG8965864.1 hypothetical protein FRC05_002981 [Tulasnella sp. 425]
MANTASNAAGSVAPPRFVNYTSTPNGLEGSPSTKSLRSGIRPTGYRETVRDASRPVSSETAGAGFNGSMNNSLHLKRKTGTEQPWPEDVKAKRLRRAGSGPMDASPNADSAVTRRSRYEPQPFGEQPNSRLESGTREKLPASVERAQRDDYEDNSASSPSSEVDELDEPLEDSQATLVQSDYSTHHLDSVDDFRQTVDSGKLGAASNLVSIQEVPTSTVDEAQAQTGPISVPLSGSPAARQTHQRHPTQPLPQFLVPHVGEATPMATTAANHPGFISRQQQFPGSFFHNPYIPERIQHSASVTQQRTQNLPLTRRSSEITPVHRQTSPLSRRQSAPYLPSTAQSSQAASSSSFGPRSQTPQVLNPPPPTRDTGLPAGVQAAYSSHLPLLRQRSEGGMPVLYQAYRSFWLPRNSNYFVLTDPTHPARRHILNAPALDDASDPNIQLSNPSFFYWDPLPLVPVPIRCFSPACSHTLEHDGFAKVLKKVAGQSGGGASSGSESWGGFWLVAARYRCENCKALAARSGKKYNSIIAWDVRLLAKLPPVLRAEFPATEIQKRFYALENTVPPEYRLDSQTFFVSVTKSSRLDEPSSSGLPRLPHPNPTPPAQSVSTLSNIRRNSSLPSLPYDSQVVDPDPNPRLGALRPLGSTPVEERASTLLPSSQTTYASSIAVDHALHSSQDSKPPIFHSHYLASNSATTLPQRPSAGHDLQSTKEPQPGRQPATPMNDVTPLFTAANFVRFSQSTNPTGTRSTEDLITVTAKSRPWEAFQDPTANATRGLKAPVVDRERAPEASVQAMDDIYLDTSYFEEGGDDEPVDGIPLAQE